MHGWYAPQMRALITFAAYSGMRPGELFALEWGDIDFDAMRVDVKRRLYRGKVDLPKSNKTRRIALTPPARDALLGQPTRQDGGLVFLSKRGVRLSQPTLSGYWGKVLARAGLEFDFYLATKHYAVHYLHATLELPPRVIAEQMGWTLAGVLKLLAVYGHGDVGALEEIDRAFKANVRPAAGRQLRRNSGCRRPAKPLGSRELIQSPRSRSGRRLASRSEDRRERRAAPVPRLRGPARPGSSGSPHGPSSTP